MRIDDVGEAVVTSRDVARVAGVSQSTVSYVMSGRRSISAETRRRAEAAVEQLTYQPDVGDVLVLDRLVERPDESGGDQQAA